MPIYPYSFQLPPLNVQDIPNDGAPGEFLGISAGGALDWLPAGGGGGSGDLLAANNLSELTNFATARTNIGLGTGDSPQFANLTLTSPSLSTSAPVTISQTWADSGQTFKALVVNAAGSSGTNSASGSLLLDLQLGSASKFKVDKNGNASIGAGQFVVGTDGLGNYSIQAYQGATKVGRIGFNEIANNIVIAPFGNTLTIITGPVGIGGNNTILRRDEADNTLALRNGAAAQTFRVYNTYTDASNYTRGQLEWSSGTFYVSTANAGTGVAAPLGFWVAGGERMRITTAGNVGIGTTAPQTKLHLLGASESLSGAYFGILKIDTNTGTNDKGFKMGALAGAGALGYGFIQAVTTNVSNDANLALNPSGGNVGIGTTSPTSKLHVYLNPAASYTTETVKFGNIHFGNGTGDYSNIWIGSIATPLTLSASNYTLANNGTNTIINGGSGGLFFHVNGAAHWNIKSTGHLLCSSDNSRDIGASGANRPRNVYVGSRITCGDFLLGSSVYFTGTANGRLLLQNTGATDFERLQFGGTADTSPAIARDGAGLKFTGAAAGLTSWIKVPPVAVSALPAAATAGVGARAFVNDATAPVFGSAVTGGGAVPVPVYSTGSAWNVG